MKYCFMVRRVCFGSFLVGFNGQTISASEPLLTSLKSVSSATQSISTHATSIPEDFALLQRAGLTEENRIDLAALIEYENSTEFLFGERFMLIDASWGTVRNALTRLKLSQDLIVESTNYIIHPCIIDACLQTMVCLDLKKSTVEGSTPPSVMPIGKSFMLFLLFLRFLLAKCGMYMKRS